MHFYNKTGIQLLLIHTITDILGTLSYKKDAAFIDSLLYIRSQIRLNYEKENIND